MEVHETTRFIEGFPDRPVSPSYVRSGEQKLTTSFSVKDPNSNFAGKCIELKQSEYKIIGGSKSLWPN